MISGGGGGGVAWHCGHPVTLPLPLPTNRTHSFPCTSGNTNTTPTTTTSSGININSTTSRGGRRRWCGGCLAFKRSDFDRFAKDANDRLELLLFEAKKAAQRLDRRYSLSQRLSSIAQYASHRARLLDQDLSISLRWRTFSSDFARNWPRYRMQLNNFLGTPIGGSLAILFFAWFTLSGWLFRFFFFALWFLPFAGPLFIASLTNKLVIKGACPACKREFFGTRNQVIRCGSCGNIVWQPDGDFFSNGGRGTGKSKSDPRIIDVDFEEK
ncbi:hypothetical protein Tsubulata_006934 [Turnera subulata]|uniref:Uncharacterized protein n=1 Tax=Turnera subulata TaxID=218843 RepID=A0A9Q0JN11_9ROSI|nr:hypothetical protein Tsubulata_006934 [Turnera subulata]